jgi:hypothetical protein
MVNGNLFVKNLNIYQYVYAKSYAPRSHKRIECYTVEMYLCTLYVL